MASIADLFGRLLLDDSGFEAAVVQSAGKAGDKAGQTLGATLSKSFKASGLAVLSAVFAGGAKGAIELDTAVKQYAADVGASAEEADKAKDAATELFKTNRQGYDEILQTLARLRTDQGLSIDQADELAASYLRFAKVAKTDAPGAVTAFDDVLDAFNLQAGDGVRLMDLLVASNQKYGGSLVQRLADLKSLAPALQGLNLTVDDAIGLENLFASTGLDASAALGALKTAVKNLQPGQTFDDLIQQISSIEDPTLRAQKAIEIFGAKGGAALAQALRPGIDSLAEFKVNAEGAAGSVQTASDAIDSSIPAQFQLALKGVMGTLSELIGPAGAIASVITGLSSLGVTFDILKVKAIAGWIATLGPVALIAGAGAAFILLVDQLSQMSAADLRAAAAGGDLTAAQAKLKAELDAGAITLDEYDSKLDAVRQAQGAQARFAAIAAGADNQAADAAAKAAVANDRGATASELAALAAANQADAQTGVGTTADVATGKVEGLVTGVGNLTKSFTDSTPIINTWATNVEERISAVADQLHEQQAAFDLAQLKRDLGFPSTTNVEAEGNLVFPQKVTKGLADYARTVRSDLTDAFRASKTAADDFFDGLHKHNLDAIEDARRTANETLEAQKKALFAGVDAAQAALDAQQQADQRRSLQQGITSAALGLGTAGDDPAAVLAAVTRLRDARKALADFDAQARIDADRATAQAASDALTAQQQHNDDVAALAVDGENEIAAARQKAFDDGLAKLEDQLLTEKGSHAKTLAAIAKLYVDAGISSKSQGAQIALGLAAGLLSEIKAVESAAQTLAKAVAKYIKTGSPAEAGIFHDDPPEAMGARVAGEFGKGLLGGFADLGPALKIIAGNLRLPGVEPLAPPAPASVTEPVAAAKATAASPRPEPVAPTGFDLAGLVKTLSDQLAAAMPKLELPVPMLPTLAPAFATAGPVAPSAPAAAVPSLEGGAMEVEIHQVLDLGNALYGSNRFIDHVSRGLWKRRS